MSTTVFLFINTTFQSTQRAYLAKFNGFPWTEAAAAVSTATRACGDIGHAMLQGTVSGIAISSWAMQKGTVEVGDVSAAELDIRIRFPRQLLCVLAAASRVQDTRCSVA